MKRITIITMVTLFLVLASASADSESGVAHRDLRMISIAFANGAAELTRLDMGQIKALKSDPELLQARIQVLTDSYIREVQRLNAVKDEQEKHYWTY